MNKSLVLLAAFHQYCSVGMNFIQYTFSKWYCVGYSFIYFLLSLLMFFSTWYTPKSILQLTELTATVSIQTFSSSIIVQSKWYLIIKNETKSFYSLDGFIYFEEISEKYKRKHNYFVDILRPQKWSSKYILFMFIIT